MEFDPNDTMLAVLRGKSPLSSPLAPAQASQDALQGENCAEIGGAKETMLTAASFSVRGFKNCSINPPVSKYCFRVISYDKFFTL